MTQKIAFFPTTNQVNTSSPDLQECQGEERGATGVRGLGPTPSEPLVTRNYVALQTDKAKQKEQTMVCTTLTLQSMLQFTTRSKSTALELQAA